MNVDFRDYKDGLIYIIGIGGCSTSGLAQILDNMGYKVAGSDQKESQFTDVLKKKGIKVYIGHDV